MFSKVGAARPALWIAAVLLIGLGLRSYHYFRGPTVWHDEAALIVNVLDKDYPSLLGPLRFSEAAPPLFLWMEKLTSLTLGDEPLALRLPAYLASCLALVLMVPVVRRFLPPAAAFWALLLFACSEQLSWHACEAKSYAFDVLVAVVLVLLFGQLQRRPLPLLLLAYALLAPAFIWLSYPACFLYGGVLVALLPAVWAQRRVATIGTYALLAVSVGVSFVALALGPAHAQRDPTILECWASCFPDWQRPWTVPLWALLSTLEVGRYCCKPLGQGLVLLAVPGGVMLWRQGRRELVALLAVPVLLLFVAACLHRYPYGGVRVDVFATPALLLLAATTVPPAFAWLRARHQLAVVPLLVFLMVPVVVSGKRVLSPWPRADTSSAAAFVDAHRLPEDPVVGNDGTHIYYFRHLGAAFHWWMDGPAPRQDRLWVVFTAQAPAEDRLRWASSAAPGWQAQMHYESTFTTTILFVKPRGEAPTS